ncbi:TetR/AcrR family transcriptional regulator [Halioxenophilus sp. WMMB6]|uniref:TetR/AcrR family transcriptional regulator n=1 Tax=Halioxenophilus sp. WMMB6 TaxID=3073815 RepID=UPI00295F251D|nr:TetR/AcrR family transcriptional regulator [Halioxenophilus sp. WMMB6]
MVASTRPDTRTHLVNTATHLFLDKSYGTISTSKICEEASVNKGTFYHFFPSKASLLIAAMDKYTQALIAELITLSNSDLSPEAKITGIFKIPAMCNEAFKQAEGKVKGCLIGNIALELSTVDSEICQATLRNLDELRAASQPIVQTFIESENLALNAVTAAEHLMALIQGGLVMAKVRNDANAVENLGKTAPAALRALATVA